MMYRSMRTFDRLLSVCGESTSSKTQLSVNLKLKVVSLNIISRSTN